MSSKAWVFAQVALVLLPLLDVCCAAATEIAPIIVPPSVWWEGADGDWSTFSFRIGTNSTQQQVVRLLPSTAVPSTWVVWSAYCQNNTNKADCQANRGAVFEPKYSTSWKEKGTYNLWFEQNLNYTGDGIYGFDTLGLGRDDKEGISLDKQVIATYYEESFPTGYFGLSPQNTNFTDFRDTYPSFMQTLKNSALIPSLSYGYTAGHKYGSTSVLGSLTLGGYDAARFKPNSMSWSMTPDNTRDLVVWLQAISASDNTPQNYLLMQSGIKVLIDTTVPWFVLPVEVCDLFEQRLGLQYDNETNLYLISDAMHSQMSGKDLNITLTLGSSPSGGSSTQIVMPYDAFELTGKPPFIAGSPRQYFPVRRGSNDNQWTLGRTFLQEAYLIANYEWRNFSISQCDYSFQNTNNQTIMAIHDRNWVPPTDSDSGASQPSTLPTGAIAGIAIAGVLVILAIAALAFARRKRKWPFHKLPRSGAAELDSDSVGHEADGRAVGGKAPYPINAHEADSKRHFVGPELAGSEGFMKSELVGSEGRRHKSELPDPNLAGVYRPEDRGELFGSDGANEVEGSRVFMELPGSPVPEYYGSSKAVQMPQMSPISPHSEATSPSHRTPLLSPQSAASPVSHHSSRRGRGSVPATSPLNESHRSPVSPDESERDLSRARSRDRGSGSGRNPSVSPGGFADGPLRDPYHDVSRDPSRSREGGNGGNFI